MEKQCRNCVLWCAYRLEQKQSAQATQMNWKFHLYEEDAPDEGGYYEAAVGAHYLWVALSVSQTAIRQGLTQAVLPGRLQRRYAGH